MVVASERRYRQCTMDALQSLAIQESADPDGNQCFGKDDVHLEVPWNIQESTIGLRFE